MPRALRPLVAGTLRQILQVFQSRGETVVENKIPQGLQVVDAELVHHIHQAAMAGVVAG
jgi:hypothetical protein